MTDKDLNTEQKILLAAKKVFIEKGLEGSRMQEIADEAGINKALLHYYFRTKDKLFEGVFREAFHKVFPHIALLMKQEIPLFDKIRLFTTQYIEILKENHFIPGFVIHELNRNPERIVDIISSIGVEPELFMKQVNDEVRKGTIRPVDPRELIVNMLAMCIFPFVAEPIIKTIIFGKDKKSFDLFIEERKKTVPEFIINSIKKNE
jgi:AcrR family transcriptional regulator